MKHEEKSTASLLTITAEIVSNLNEGFLIKLYNDETDEATSVDSVDAYADYIIRSVNSSDKEEFKALWLPSPYAKKEDIDLIGRQLGEIQKRFDIELEI